MANSMRNDNDVQKDNLQVYGHMHKVSPYFYTVSLIAGFLVYFFVNREALIASGGATPNAMVFVYMALSTVLAYVGFRLHNWYMGRQPLTLAQLQFIQNQKWSQPAADALCVALCDSTPSALQAKQLWAICRLQIESQRQREQEYAVHLERVKRRQMEDLLHNRFCAKNASTK